MADRNAPASFTFEEWRVEFNELSTDVGDIASFTIDYWWYRCNRCD